jgi:hypothetical protein
MSSGFSPRQRLTKGRPPAYTRRTMDQSVSLPPLPALPPPPRDLGAGAPRGALKNVRYTHNAMIDLIIQNPWIKQYEIADHFGYTQGWVSQVFSSDSFQARLAERKEELVDPAIRATVEERFKALVLQSLEVLKKKLESPAVSDELALGALNGAAKALGYGARAPLQIQQNFVVQVPAKASSSNEWVSAQRGSSESSPRGGLGGSAHSLTVDASVSPPVLEPPVLSATDLMLEELNAVSK